MDNIYNRIEEQFKQRVSSCPSAYGKPGSKKYSDQQAEFFTGAMAALIAIVESEQPLDLPADMKERHGLAMPPKWVISIMRGDVIAKP